MKQGGAAVQYAAALLALANEKQQAEAIGHEMLELKELVGANQLLRFFLENPAVGMVERTGLIERVFRGNVSPLVWNTIGVLNLKGRLKLLPAIADAFHELLDEQMGRIEVDVTVARRLEPAELEEVRRRVGQALKKDPVLHQIVDESIIGGLVLRTDEKMIDGSVRAQLEGMKRQLLAAGHK
jgi:F-type H+-transporting ATPase subunit delta